MNTQALVDKLKAQPFEPFEIIISSSERYRVLHPEMVRLTPRGVVYVFEPMPDQGEEIYEMPNVLSMMHVTSLEPIRPTTEISMENT